MYRPARRKHGVAGLYRNPSFPYQYPTGAGDKTKQRLVRVLVPVVRLPRWNPHDPRVQRLRGARIALDRKLDAALVVLLFAHDLTDSRRHRNGGFAVELEAGARLDPVDRRRKALGP